MKNKNIKQMKIDMLVYRLNRLQRYTPEFNRTLIRLHQLTGHWYA